MQQKVIEEAQERHTKVDRATVNKNPFAEQGVIFWCDGFLTGFVRKSSNPVFIHPLLITSPRRPNMPSREGVNQRGVIALK